MAINLQPVDNQIFSQISLKEDSKREEAAPSRDINQNVIQTAARPVMVEMSTQCSSQDFERLETFSLKNVDVEILDDIQQLGAPAPYREGAGNSARYPDNWVTSKVNQALSEVSNKVYWTARSCGKYVRSCFYQTEYELLMALEDPNQQIRATKSWFGIGNSKPREELYGLSNGTVRSVVLDPLLGLLWNEGIKRSDCFNVLEILKAVPDILYGELFHLFGMLNVEIESAISNAVVVLQDQDYDNPYYLTQLENELVTLIDRIEIKTAKLTIKTFDNAKGSHEAVSKKLRKMVKEAFPALTPEDNTRYKVDFLDKKRDEAFEFGSKIALQASSIQKEVSKKLLRMPASSIAEKKKRVQMLAQALIDFRSFSKELLEDNKAFLEEFQRKLNLRVI